VFQRLMIAGYRPSEDEIALAAFMGGAWGGLARDGVPVVPGGPSWPFYAPATAPPSCSRAETSTPRRGCGRTTATSGTR